MSLCCLADLHSLLKSEEYCLLELVFCLFLFLFAFKVVGLVLFLFLFLDFFEESEELVEGLLEDEELGSESGGELFECTEC